MQPEIQIHAPKYYTTNPKSEKYSIQYSIYAVSLQYNIFRIYLYWKILKSSSKLPHGDSSNVESF